MKQYTKQLNITPTYPFQVKNQLEQLLFFDIETTGFSASSTTLYLIGCAFYKNNSWHLLQLLNDDKESELELLTAFCNLSKQFTTLIHYNGEGFDLPYLEKKCIKYALAPSFLSLESLDIYKRIRPFQKILHLDSLKQKDIELFLDYNRTDTFHGGELITIYEKYVKNKEKELEDFLLLHNTEDIEGMLNISEILNYEELFTGNISFDSIVEETSQIVLKMNLFFPIKKRISIGKNGITFLAFQDHGTLTIPIYTGEMKFFYKNYKDYYYLPKEDISIHKSVAFYVDKDYRTKAKAATCYSKKTGKFLPQFNEQIEPYFKIDYYDKINYFELTDEVKNNPLILQNYTIHILEYLKKESK